MPKKTSEELREKVVALRKEGATYTQIEANPETFNPETGAPLARPTLIKILKEAGLTKGARAAAPTVRPSSEPTPSAPKSKPAQPSSTTPPLAHSDGVSEFMPKGKPKAKAQVEFQCDSCGTEFVGDEGDELPESCPECGQ